MKKKIRNWICKKVTGMPIQDVHRLAIFSAKSVWEADYDKSQTFSHSVIKDVIDRNMPALASLYFKKRAVIYVPTDPSNGDSDIRAHFDGSFVN